ncbi:hypothetical protein D3C80_1658680 [compost metagenome]
MAIFRVRGIGVAVSVRISTSARIALIRSLWRTPNRCSSSTISSPRSFQRRSLCSSLWVPMMISTLPSTASSITCCCSLALRKRDIISMRIGQVAKRSRKLSKCCCASRVVGTSTATCLPFSTARKAARIATSVLPKPTSPHTRRSMASGWHMSLSTALIACSWSGVVSNGKAWQNS